MPETIVPTIPPSKLPKGWRKKAAEEFGVSEATIYGVAAGIRSNVEIFQFLLDLAEEKKQKDLAINQRVTALTK